MLKKEKPDVAYVIQLPQNAYDIAATVIESKCNLILKEPLGITLEQARQLALLAKKHRVLTGVPFFRRFSPIVRKGKILCEQKGRIHTAVATFYKHAMNGKPYYRGATDILYCDAIHAIDTLRYFN
jgi:predicted dehydrogenase